MSRTLKTDKTGRLLTPTLASESVTNTAKSPQGHLAQLFAISEHYDAHWCNQWFAVIRNRGGSPTAITLVGDELPSQVICLEDPGDPGCYEITIGSLEPPIVELSQLPADSSALEVAIQHSNVNFYIRGIDGRFQLIIGDPETRPHIPGPIAAGQSIFDSYAPDTLAIIQQADNQIIATGQPKAVSERITDTAGSRVFSSTKFPVYDDSGELIAISGLSYDITEHTRNLDRLTETQDRITRSILSSSLTVLITTLEGVITESNRSFSAKYGYDQHSIIGKSVAEIGIVSPDKQHSLTETLVRHGEIINSHQTFYARDRTPLAVTMNAVVIDIDGKPHVVTMSADESRAQAAEKRLQLIADASNEGIVLHDKNIMIEVNQRSCEIYGRSRDELIGLSIWELIPKSHRAAVRNRINTDDHTSYELTIERPDQSKRTLLIRSHDVTESGQLYRIAVFRDITDEQELKNQLRRAQKLEVLGQLTGGIAHDFNNILAAILGFNDLLIDRLDQDDNQKLLQWAEQVRKAGLRGRDLIRQMLSFSRGGSTQPVPTAAENIARDVETMIKVSLASNIKIESHIKPVADILIDPIQLNQVLLNLCINASHAIAEDGGTITINLTEKQINGELCSSCMQAVSGNYVAISVSDDGAGMNADTLEKIFEPFFSTKEIGTGMGLAVIHGIIHDCNSHILVESQPQLGSVFTVLFPPIAHQNTVTASDLNPTAPQLKTLVVVDDDQIVADMVYRVLQQQDYKVICFHDPQLAWDEYRANGDGWNLLITDQNMPGLKGMELANRIRQRSSQLPIIIHTGYSEALDQQTVREHGIVLLQKPVELSELLSTVNQLLELEP